MERSDQIDTLAAALAKAQGAMEAAERDRANPEFRHKYATLSALWAAARKPLSDNGLALVQDVPEQEDGALEVTTLLLHTSGQWLKGNIRLPVLGQPLRGGGRGPITAQSIGSAITYGRRYGLAAMLGVVADEESDDDGNAASQPSSDELAERRDRFVKEIADLLESSFVTDQEREQWVAWLADEQPEDKLRAAIARIRRTIGERRNVEAVEAAKVVARQETAGTEDQTPAHKAEDETQDRSAWTATKGERDVVKRILASSHLTDEEKALAESMIADPKLTSGECRSLSNTLSAAAAARRKAEKQQPEEEPEVIEDEPTDE